MQRGVVSSYVGELKQFNAGSPLHGAPFRPTGNPHVRYRSGHDAYGGYWIEATCQRCGDFWRKRCMQPPRTALHVQRYAALHAHGLVPQRR